MSVRAVLLNATVPSEGYYWQVVLSRIKVIVEEPSFSYSFFRGLFFMPVYCSNSVYEYAVVEYLQHQQYGEHSTAQHSVTTPAQSSKPSTCRSGYLSKEVCTYMRAASGLFSWSIELLAFASRLFAHKMLDHLPHLSFRSILPCERALRAEPPATRSTLYRIQYHDRLFSPPKRYPYGSYYIRIPGT